MTIALIILEALALAAFFASDPAGFALLVPAGLAAMYLLARGSAAVLSRKADRPLRPLDPRITLAFSPLILLFLKHLSGLVFLRDIRGLLPPLAALGTLVLFALLRRDIGRVPNSVRLSSRRIWPWLALASFAVNAFFASGLVFPAHPLTGDEPHYLLITQSLIDDGDINLFNNTERQGHLRFYPGPMDTHAKPGRRGPGTLYSRHLPGLPLLLAPFYALADPLGDLDAFVFLVRLPMCLLTALLGAAFFLFAFDLTGKRNAALAAWGLFSLTAPVFFYSGLIYPEVPAALISLLSFRALFLRPRPGSAALLLSGAGIGLLPWLSIKYAVLSLALFVLAAAPRILKIRESRRDLIRLSAAPVILGSLFLLFLGSTYGHVHPLAVYTGAATPEILSAGLPWRAANFAEFVSAGLAVFFEQKTGVFVFAPVYLLAGAGFLILRRRDRTLAARLLAVFGAFWILSAASYYLGGYCPPGRPLLPVIWILAGFLAVAIAAPSGRTAALTKTALSGLSLGIVALSLPFPGLLYQISFNPRRPGVALESRFLASAGNLLFDPVACAPALKSSAAFNAWPLAAWIATAALFAILLSRPGPQPAGGNRPFNPAARAGIVLTASLLVLAFAFFRVRLDPRTAHPAKIGELFFQDENQYGPESSGFWTKGNREAVVVLKSRARLSALSVSLSSAEAGAADVRADRFRSTVRHDPVKSPRHDLVFENPRGFRWRDAYLYVVGVRERRPFIPFLADRRVGDNRSLGVFVEIGGSAGRFPPERKESSK